VARTPRISGAGDSPRPPGPGGYAMLLTTHYFSMTISDKTLLTD
jgi:hypothetical protein